MSTPFIGEIRMFGGNFAIRGWAFCNGALLDIQQNDTLFSLIGTTYGGDGQSTFALPDLQGRIPIHQGGGFTLGQKGGVESVTLTTQQIPSHAHPPQCNSAAGDLGSPQNAVWAASATNQTLYSDGPPTATMNSACMTSDGGSQPHENMMPYLVISFIISLEGIYPSQN
jgi:microcystin-dependent protein